MPPPIPPHPKSYSSPVQQIVDEDSSSSANSGEINDVFGISKGNRDGAGVTPGLRRRRERAERQKTFMREQQEAAASGIRPFEERPDENGHGKQTISLSLYCFQCYVVFLIRLTVHVISLLTQIHL